MSTYLIGANEPNHPYQQALRLAKQRKATPMPLTTQQIHREAAELAAYYEASQDDAEALRAFDARLRRIYTVCDLHGAALLTARLLRVSADLSEHVMQRLTNWGHLPEPEAPRRLSVSEVLGYDPDADPARFEDLILDSIVPACCSEGCEVEPDGTCPHGHPSVLVALGII
jgi:hypothetical protein